MAEKKNLTAPIPSKKWPAGIPYIFTNEIFERFSFYGTRGILVVFMTQYLMGIGGKPDLMNAEQAKTFFHLFVAAVYFTPILGSLLCDIFIGKFKTIILFAIINCLGLLTLVLDQTRLGLTVGLALIALGSGAIKPCVSANVGDQFGKTNQHLIEKVYAWFYFSINLGAAATHLLAPLLLDKYGARIAFGSSSAAMILATIVFWMGRWKFVHMPPGGIGFVKETLSGEGLRALGKLCVIYLFVAVFWSLWEQIDSAWILQAEHMNRNWLGHEWLPAQIVAVNPLLIMALIPLFNYVIYPAISLIFPLTPLRKVSIGFFVTAVAFAIPALIQRSIDAGFEPSISWQILAHIVLASAEVMVSITCLEFSYTQAPKKMKSFIMAVFLLAINVGDLFTAAVNYFIQNEDGTSKLAGPSYFWFFTGLMMVASVIFIFVAAGYREKTYILDEKAPEGLD